MITLAECLRRLGLAPRPTVTRERALELAHLECDRRGWPWTEPIQVCGGLLTWHLTTNASHRGGNVNIRIDTRTGHVKKAAFARR